jgi:hypothetical protein
MRLRGELQDAPPIRNSYKLFVTCLQLKRALDLKIAL